MKFRKLSLLIGLILSLTYSQLDISIPSMTEELPGPGKRVRQTSTEYIGTQVYHSLYLPTNWELGKKYPVFVEYTGNNYAAAGSTGEVKDAHLGYGLTGGVDFIWVVMPYISIGNQQNEVTWWGDKQATIDYCKTNLPRILNQFSGDSNNVIIGGFSRGAIAVNYIGMADDEIAKFWKGFVAHDHYDGVRENWGYPDAVRDSALIRLDRLKGRPQLITAETTTQFGQMTKEYLDTLQSKGQFTFIDVPVENLFTIPEGNVIHTHTDLWPIRESDSRIQARLWLSNLVNSPVLINEGQSLYQLPSSISWKIMLQNEFGEILNPTLINTFNEAQYFLNGKVGH